MFIVLALPRSRTAWLSEFLSYPPKKCGHDIAAESSSIADFINRLSPLDGTCETGAVLGWKLLRTVFPEAKIIVITRPMLEIKRSFARFGIVPLDGELESRRLMLDACSASPGVTTFEYEQLDDPMVCKWIFETCLEIECGRWWYESLAGTNIQVDMGKQLAALYARQPQLSNFKREVAAAVKRLDGGAGCLGLH